jgi:two-component system heavy metal sensor histidine kinase CusS
MIDNLLFVARAENPETQIEKQSVMLRSEVGTVLEFYESAAAESGIRLNVTIPAELCVELDRMLFQRALCNLIENALRYTAAGGRIRIVATQERESVELRVSDDGIGIAPEDVPHICDRFYRADQSRSNQSGGAGIGLAIVKSIVELHGGSIQVTSEVKRGTNVALRFPTSADFPPLRAHEQNVI